MSGTQPGVAGPPGPDAPAAGPRVSRPAAAPAPVSTIPVEARTWQGQRAGIVTRVVANIIDVAVVLVALVCAYVGWAATLYVLNPRGFHLPSLPSLVVTVLIVIWTQGAYFALAWMTSGRTYGDHVMGLRVVNGRGRRMRPWTAVLRAGFCVLFPIGLFWVVVSPQNRSVQDVVLRTQVRYDWAVRMNNRGATPAG